ncbi:MAG TPA: hypothetical protein VJ507_02665 [Candidatus Bathyarchaeia archaeon]|nr:hypothetical protein [Candidatus Bathyarchaeia archaeon]
MKEAVNNNIRLRGLSFNLIKRSGPKTVVEKQNILESMRRVQALQGRISNLRLQCEELRAAMNNKTGEDSLCVECGQQIENNEAVIYSTASERRAICKKCFSEIWKCTEEARLA